MSQNKIDTASKATDDIFGHVGKALGPLNDQFEGRVINGAGVLSRPPLARAALSFAIDELTKARDLLDRTAWPTDADYDAA